MIFFRLIDCYILSLFFSNNFYSTFYFNLDQIADAQAAAAQVAGALTPAPHPDDAQPIDAQATATATTTAIEIQALGAGFSRA